MGLYDTLASFGVTHWEPEDRVNRRILAHIRAAMADGNIGNNAMAALLGIKPNRLSRMLSENRTFPAALVQRVCEKLQIKYRELLEKDPGDERYFEIGSEYHAAGGRPKKATLPPNPEQASPSAQPGRRSGGGRGF